MKKKRTLLSCGMNIFRSVTFAVLICVVVLFSLSFLLESGWGKVLLQSLFLLIFGFILYNEAWYQGDKDKNLVQFVHITEDLSWGVKIGFVGMILPAAASLILVFTKVFTMLPDITFVYRFINPHFAVLMALIMPVADRTTYGFGTILLATSFQLVIPLFTGVGYVLGYKRISLNDKLVFKSKGKKG